MDRRHCVLAIAVVASISTDSFESPPPTVYLFRGFELLQPGAFTLDAKQPERAWRITAELVLPAEAEHDDFDSELSARVGFVDAETEHGPVSYWLDDCAGEAIAVASADSEPDIHVGVDDVFVDCVPETPCVASVCLGMATSIEDAPVDVKWETWVNVSSGATLDPEADSIDVPIEITIEEIEP